MVIYENKGPVSETCKKYHTLKVYAVFNTCLSMANYPLKSPEFSLGHEKRKETSVPTITAW